jgi:hypothetical protein
MSSRYDGKPLLRLLECYVLEAIGQLSAVDRSKLEKMTPNFQAVYKLDGDWRSVVSQVMHFPGTLDENIRSLWKRNRELASRNGQELMAEDFAKMVVDENLTKG